MIHNAEKFNNKIMKNFFLLIKIVVVYLFLISNGMSKESIYYSEGIKLFQKKEFDKYSKVSFYSNVTKASLKSDLIILHTEWNEFKLLEFKKIVKKSNFKIFDMRNLYSSKLMKKNKINYFGIGK